MSLPQHNQKQIHISPIVAAWEASGARGAFRAAQRKILHEFITSDQGWRWQRPEIVTELKPPPFWPAYAPVPPGTPKIRRFYPGRWRTADGSGSTSRALLEIERRTEVLLRRLPEKVRDDLWNLCDSRSIKVIERAARRATAWPPTKTSTPFLKNEIAARNKAAFIGQGRRVLDDVDKAAEARGGRSKTSEKLRRLMDRFERDEILFLPDDESAP
jgi:hypothetical protein